MIKKARTNLLLPFPRTEFKLYTHNLHLNEREGKNKVKKKLQKHVQSKLSCLPLNGVGSWSRIRPRTVQGFLRMIIVLFFPGFCFFINIKHFRLENFVEDKTFHELQLCFSLEVFYRTCHRDVPAKCIVSSKYSTLVCHQRER